MTSLLAEPIEVTLEPIETLNALGIRYCIGRSDGRTLCLATAEDTIVQKLRWYKRGGEVSDQQWRDILDILRVQGDALDRAHIGKWATLLGVDDLLARALNEESD